MMRQKDVVQTNKHDEFCQYRCDDGAKCSAVQRTNSDDATVRYDGDELHFSELVNVKCVSMKNAISMQTTLPYHIM